MRICWVSAVLFAAPMAFAKSAIVSRDIGDPELNTWKVALSLAVQDLKGGEHSLYWPSSKKDENMGKSWLWSRV